MKKQETLKAIKNLIFEFLKYQEIVKGRSESTLKIYKNRLYKFFNWCGWLTVEQIKLETIWQFRLYLNEKKINKRTQVHYLVILRNFLKFLKDNKNLNVLGYHKIELPKLPEREIKVLNKEELEKLLKAPQGNNLKALRDRALLEVLFSTGLRISELLSLNRDIDLKNGEILVKGKGNKIRTVFLSQQAIEVLKNYLKKRTDDHPALFIALAKNYPLKRLTARAVQKIIKFYAKKIGLFKNVHPHLLRHQLATFLISAGVPLRLVQELLGHKNISTTQIYTHISKPELKAIYQKIMNKKENT